ncbi:class I SAM-dependent methyltransferase [Pseudalkalibacillus berkeleyi]|uniref:Methyltransferase domain-containing protein n=1 Tax=Pseudalkalibacillus berkeleyi TaxID=1069813 RepID=A0ABS9GY28_9BACL|nr:class I SAM-dependent methyltransferase [Pseudalkalibacillus berkeleyi]MCF6136726.1 methyltransferase domain-containing protein [Pseudalkalibacillus berkeleyi]
MSIEMMHKPEKAPFDESNFEFTNLLPSYRIDLRNPRNEMPDKFFNANLVSDWSQLSWKDVGKPYEVKTMSVDLRNWEREHEQKMPVKTSWEYFNRSFHEWFIKDVPKERSAAKEQLFLNMKQFNMNEVKTSIGELMRLSLWNYAHRVEDGIWDPRGKRALFEGLDVKKPNILFLGAAEGYEAMQLHAMYPGGQVVMVDYDEFCKTNRFAEFPDTYPFLGTNEQTGSPRVWYKKQMNIDYVVDDIRNLKYGKEFDIVMSVGLLEHVPDAYKEEILDFHRRFLKPGGYVIMTTPRNQWKSRMYYRVMSDVMNHTYRELMDIRQMGLYVYQSGFDIMRHGYMKVHNGIVAKQR